MAGDSVQRVVWELRVHGVGNTPPESVLKKADDPGVQFSDPPRMKQLTGDAITGFYQRDDDTPEDGLLVEAYSWGRLTAGQGQEAWPTGLRRETRLANLRRAGWTLLLPFALINAALWARPRISYEPREKGTVALTAWLLRALAVGLTCTMILAVSGVAMDVIAWQCRPRQGSCAGPQVIKSLLSDAFFTTGARRTLAGTVIPLLVVAGFFWLSGWSVKHYEAVRFQQAPLGAPDTDRNPLEHPHFWRGEIQVLALRKVHVGAALSMVGQALAGCVWAGGTKWSGVTVTALVATCFAVAGLSLALACLMLPVVRVRGADEQGPVVSVMLLMPGVLGAVAVILAATAAWRVPVPPRGAAPFPNMPGLDGTIRVTYLLMFLGLMALMVLTSWQADTRGQLDRGADSVVWLGLASPMFAGAAWVAALVYSVVLLFGAQTLMGGPGGPGNPEFAVMMRWNAVGLLVCAAVAAVVASSAAFRLRAQRRQASADLKQEVPAENLHARQRAVAVGGARGLHRYIGYRALAQVGWLATGLVVVISIGAAIAMGRPITLRQRPLGESWSLLGVTLPDSPAHWLQALSASLATLTFIALVALGYGAYKYPLVQRTLGMVWDIATFWPRGAHPFAPPCCAELAVPQLTTRIEGEPDRLLVLAGHSQGSVLCAATVAQLSPARRASTFLITVGTQLTRLYGRAFPALFAREGRERLATLLGGSPAGQLPWRDVRWRSLYRDTDYLGWPISATQRPCDPTSTSDCDDLGRVVDVRVTDPARLDPRTGEGLVPARGKITDPRIYAHADYYLTEEYADIADSAMQILRTSPSPEEAADHAIGDPGQTPRHLSTERGRWGGRLAVVAGVLAMVAVAMFPVGAHLSGAGAEPHGEPPVHQRPPVIRPTPSAPAAARPARSVDRPRVTTRIPVGANPAGLAISPDGSLAYVALTREHRVAVVDLLTNRVIHRIPMPQAPRTITFTPDGRSAYVTLFGPHDDPLSNADFTGDTIVKVDTTRWVKPKTIQAGQNLFGAAATPDGKRMFVASHDTNQVWIVDVRTGATASMAADDNPHAVAFLPDGSKGYIANHASDEVTVFSPADRHTIARIHLPPGTSPHGLAVPSAGHELYVAGYDANSVTVVDTRRDHVLHKIDVGEGPQAVTLAKDERHAYVVNNTSDTISVINTRTKHVTRTIRVGNSPIAIAVRPDGRYAYVSSLRDTRLAAIKLT